MLSMLSALCALVAAPASADGSEGEAGGPTVQLMVELASPSAVAVHAENQRQGLSRSRAAERTVEHLRRLDAEQVRFLEAVVSTAGSEETSSPMRAVFRVQRVLNGIALRVPVAEAGRMADQLRRRPEVRRVRPMPPKERSHGTTLPFLEVPSAWDGTGLAGTPAPGVSGRGLRIGIVDTGIDYLHANFGGSGLAAAYAANDTTTLDGFFPTPKVAGGTDFVGDAYDASSANPAVSTPQPDADPMDCDGHGTHVAGTAAGFGVMSSGATYPGPYDSAAPLGDLRIGPGVAPEATLYALRVFGCAGTSNVVELALEWAVDPNGDGDFSDRLDVVNLSLASRFGAADDPTAEAADAASQAGVVVVAAAGNDGDVAFVVGTPASADSAIAVASVWDSDDAFPTRGIRVAAPDSVAGTYRALGAAFGPSSLPAPITAAGALVDPPDACAPLADPASVAGHIAVIERSDDCTEPTRVRHAQDAGAVAVVVAHHEPELLSGLDNDGTGGDIVIPAVVVQREAGRALLDAIASQATAGLEVPIELDQVPLGDTLALNSSRGPRQPAPAANAGATNGAGTGMAVASKPDVAAPGVLVTSARLGDAVSGGTGARLLSGTSMASPHVAGLAALVRQRRPDWQPAEVKAAIMGTATDVFLDPEGTPPRYGTSRVGAGRVRAPGAVDTELLAWDTLAPARVGVSFGHLEVVDIQQRERTVTIANRGPVAVELEAEIDPIVDLPGVTLSLPSSGSVSVPAGGSVELTVRLEARAADLRHVRDPTQTPVLFGFPRHWQSEQTAYLRLRPSEVDRPAIRVPIHASVRPASRTRAVAPLDVVVGLDPGSSSTGSASLELEGVGVDTGPTPPRDLRSLVGAFELQHLDAAALEAGDERQIGAVGVASDVAAVGVGAGVLHFAVATATDSSSPSLVRVEILIDTDDDGDDELSLYSSDLGSVTFGSFATDGFVAVLRDLDTFSESVQLPLEVLGPAGFHADAFHTVPFHTRLRVLSARAADLGLAPGGGPIAYRVRVVEGISTSLVAGAGRATQPAPLDFDPRWQPGPERPSQPMASSFLPLGASESERFRFDPEHPGLDATGGLGTPELAHGSPIHFDLPGATIPIEFDLDSLARHRSLGLLLFHHHGVRGERVEAVGLEGTLPDLRVEQMARPGLAVPGRLLTYVLEVENVGSATARQVVLTDQLDDAIEAFDAASSDPACAAFPEEVRCQLGDLEPGTTRRVEITVRVAADAVPGTSVENRASVAVGLGVESHPFDNDSRLATPVSRVLPVLEKAVVGDSGGQSRGQSVLYQLRFENRGVGDQADLPGAELVDVLPAGLAVRNVGASAGSVGFDESTRRLEWSGALPVGLVVEIEIVATVEAAAGTTISNQASLVYDGDLDGRLEVDALGQPTGADGQIGSDDPATPTPGDPTVFVVLPASLEIPTASRAGSWLLALALAGLALRLLRR